MLFGINLLVYKLHEIMSYREEYDIFNVRGYEYQNPPYYNKCVIVIADRS